VADEEWPQEEEQRSVVLADWDTSNAFGDRRQEIVFIGVNMDEAKIKEQVRVLACPSRACSCWLRWALAPPACSH